MLCGKSMLASILISFLACDSHLIALSAKSQPFYSLLALHVLALGLSFNLQYGFWVSNWMLFAALCSLTVMCQVASWVIVGYHMPIPTFILTVGLVRALFPKSIIESRLISQSRTVTKALLCSTQMIAVFLTVFLYPWVYNGFHLRCSQGPYLLSLRETPCLLALLFLVLMTSPWHCDDWATFWIIMIISSRLPEFMAAGTAVDRKLLSAWNVDKCSKFDTPSQSTQRVILYVAFVAKIGTSQFPILRGVADLPRVQGLNAWLRVHLHETLFKILIN
jgi:hypothetical protein